MSRTAILLRGINLGKRRMKMDDLRVSLEKIGHPHAQTLLASGNIVVDGKPTAKLQKDIEALVEKDFRFFSEVILREGAELKALADKKPFGDYVEDKDTKLWAYFLSEPHEGLKQIEKGKGDGFEITYIGPREFCAVGFRRENGRFSEGLDKITKPFGKYRHVTNRNWNTVLKLIEMCVD